MLAAQPAVQRRHGARQGRRDARQRARERDAYPVALVLQCLWAAALQVSDLHDGQFLCSQHAAALIETDDVIVTDNSCRRATVVVVDLGPERA